MIGAYILSPVVAWNDEEKVKETEEDGKLGFGGMDGGEVAHPLTGNQQAGPKKQKTETSKGKSREERLNMYMAKIKDSIASIASQFSDDEDTSGPHGMTFREFASIKLNEIESGVSNLLYIQFFFINLINVSVSLSVLFLPS